MRSTRIIRIAGSLLVAAALATGCSNKPSENEVTVFAAASLTDAFKALAADFAKKHPELDVKLNFSGSQSLRTQIENGAQAQVFASANAKHMQALHSKKLVDEPVTFVHNELVIVVPADNPAKIASLKDLPNAKRLVVAEKSVPAGAYTEQMIQRASSEYGVEFSKLVHKRVVSRENHVRQTLQKVVLGEADAAIVYATDAAAAGDKIKTIRIPAQHNIVASYPIASMANHKAGKLFVAFILSDAGKARLKQFGFRPVGTSVAKKK